MSPAARASFGYRTTAQVTCIRTSLRNTTDVGLGELWLPVEGLKFDAGSRAEIALPALWQCNGSIRLYIGDALQRQEANLTFAALLRRFGVLRKRMNVEPEQS